MKKIICLSLGVLLLSGCSSKADNANSENVDVQSDVMNSSLENKTVVVYDEKYYASMDELADDSKGIFEGVVVGSHLEYIDDTDGSVVSEADVSSSIDSFIQLYTVYDINVTKSYKGDFYDGSTISLKILGDNETVLSENSIELAADPEYLFFVNYIDNSPAWLVSSTQGIYKLENDNYAPVFESNTISINSDSLIEQVVE